MLEVWPLFLPYSPECVEGECSEVRLVRLHHAPILAIVVCVT